MTKKMVIINVILMCVLSQNVCHLWFWEICKRPLIPIFILVKFGALAKCSFMQQLDFMDFIWG